MTMAATEADALLRRLSARGDGVAVRTSKVYVPGGTHTGPEGQQWEVSVPHTVIHVSGWRRGQQGNPFCAWAVTGPDILAALREAEKKTRPPYLSVDDLVWRARAERQRAR